MTPHTPPTPPTHRQLCHMHCKQLHARQRHRLGDLGQGALRLSGRLGCHVPRAGSTCACVSCCAACPAVLGRPAVPSAPRACVAARCLGMCCVCVCVYMSRVYLSRARSLCHVCEVWYVGHIFAHRYKDICVRAGSLGAPGMWEGAYVRAHVQGRIKRHIRAHI